jgi:hypothetical protein
VLQLAGVDDVKYDGALRNTIGLLFSTAPVETPSADLVFKPEDIAARSRSFQGCVR